MIPSVKKVKGIWASLSLLWWYFHRVWHVLWLNHSKPIQHCYAVLKFAFSNLFSLPATCWRKRSACVRRVTSATIMTFLLKLLSVSFLISYRIKPNLTSLKFLVTLFWNLSVINRVVCWCIIRSKNNANIYLSWSVLLSRLELETYYEI